MKERIKGIILGLFIAIMVASTSVAAITGTVQKNLAYNNIKITLNEAEVKPTDAAGNYVEPFIIDGTTYLPVRAVANALNLGVAWDGANNTVKLSTPQEAVTINETEMFNKSGIKVVANDIVFDKDEYAFVVSLTVTNKLGFEVYPTVTTSKVNGVKMGYSYIYLDGAKEDELVINPNSTVKVNVGYPKDALNAAGIKTPIDITLGFDFYDKDWNTYCATEATTIITSANNAFKQTEQAGIVLKDDGGFRIIAKNLVQNNEYIELVVLIENNSSETQEIWFLPESFGAGSIKVNGKNIYDFMFGYSLFPGEREVTCMYLEPEDKEQKVYSIEINHEFFGGKVSLFVDDDGSLS